MTHAVAPPTASRSTLVITAHAGDFVWRGGGAIALAASRGENITVARLTFGERGESAKAWREGRKLEEIKAIRQGEAERAAATLGAEVRFFDAGDYPLLATAELTDRLVAVHRETQPDVVLTHPTEDPYNGDHPASNRMALEARILAHAVGYPGDGDIIGAPPVFCFEPHQPEMSGFRPEVLLDITEVWETKRAAMECLGAQQHLWDYYTDLAVQLRRNAGPNLGLAHRTMAEAYMRPFPQIAKEQA
ncbi:PIG-L deacetylase family protein [Streptomyces sp. NPDC048564]|uniref:PIG-L deacetylase family protein n=1 Tax=Streptomyces sp. NPDC048564 TaxID=3155760 RepID=UPI00342142D1